MATETEKQDKRQAYLAKKITHAEYYGWLAERIGKDYLRACIPQREKIAAKLKADEHLNNVPLWMWDCQDSFVSRAAARAGFTYWSLSDTVCTLKELAKADVKAGTLA